MKMERETMKVKYEQKRRNKGKRADGEHQLMK
jgi:hypothetical protein